MKIILDDREITNIRLNKILNPTNQSQTLNQFHFAAYTKLGAMNQAEARISDEAGPTFELGLEKC